MPPRCSGRRSPSLVSLASTHVTSAGSLVGAVPVAHVTVTTAGGKVASADVTTNPLGTYTGIDATFEP